MSHIQRFKDVFDPRRNNGKSCFEVALTLEAAIDMTKTQFESLDESTDPANPLPGDYLRVLTQLRTYVAANPSWEFFVDFVGDDHHVIYDVCL
jgi:hypothetical protein